MSSSTRLVEVRTKILKQNDLVARALREQFQQAGVTVVSLVSSPGTGKTAFLEATLRLLRDRFRVAALVGDLATDNDARRLVRGGAHQANHHGHGLSLRSRNGSFGFGRLGPGRPRLFVYRKCR